MEETNQNNGASICFCAKCGAQMQTGDKFCGKCGSVNGTLPQGEHFIDSTPMTYSHTSVMQQHVSRREYFRNQCSSRAKKLGLFQWILFWVETAATAVFLGLAFCYFFLAVGAINAMWGISDNGTGMLVVVFVFFCVAGFLTFITGFLSCRRKGIVASVLFIFFAIFTWRLLFKEWYLGIIIPVVNLIICLKLNSEYKKTMNGVFSNISGR
jgi:hypothetical protein